MNDPYQYKECGLETVWLENGYSIERDAWGDIISLVDVDGLNNAIGSRLVSQARPLNGAELRFLRIELLSDVQRLGAALGIDPSLIAVWETERKAPLPDPTADHQIRRHYLEVLQSVQRAVAASSKPGDCEAPRADAPDAGDDAERHCFRRVGSSWVAVS